MSSSGRLEDAYFIITIITEYCFSTGGGNPVVGYGIVACAWQQKR